MSSKHAEEGEEAHRDTTETHGPDSLDLVKKAHIERVLRMVGHDLNKAAALLEITVKELKGAMRRLGI